jgi:hypothetical protein
MTRRSACSVMRSNALVGHSLAEASVLKFIQDITARLRSDMQAAPRAKTS